MVDYQLSVVKNIAAVSRNEPDFLNGYRLCSYQTTCSTERLPVCASKNPKQSVAPQFTSRDIQRDGKGNTFSCDFQANLQKCYYSVFTGGGGLLSLRRGLRAVRPFFRSRRSLAVRAAAVRAGGFSAFGRGFFFSLLAAFGKNKKIGQKFCGAIFFLLTFARKDNSLRINRLVGLLENWVMR